LSSSKKLDTTTNRTSALEKSVAETFAGYDGPTPMNLLSVNGERITLDEHKRRTEEDLCMYCGDSRHFAASFPRKLKVVSGEGKINPFKEDLGKRKNKEEESERD
jgi:hypothetical protein